MTTSMSVTTAGSRNKKFMRCIGFFFYATCSADLSEHTAPCTRSAYLRSQGVLFIPLEKTNTKRYNKAEEVKNDGIGHIIKA